MKTAHKISLFLVCLMTLGLPFPTELSAQNGTPGKPVLNGIRDKRVSLAWQRAEEVYGIFDDFESHRDFAINSPGEIGWQYADMDRDKEYYIGNHQFENVGQPSAFRIWRPSKTIPAYTAERGLPHSGEKCLISFSTINDYRNDWLISPDLTKYAFADTLRLSFWARTFNNSHGEELINIGYSTTDMNNSSFTFVNGKTPVAVPESTPDHPGMYHFEYIIPNTAKYIAINCVTHSGQALLIDDIAIATNKVRPTKSTHNYLIGYNVYRGEIKANTELITQTSFTDVVTAYGTVEYTVEAVFEDGTKTRSEALSVEIPDIHRLPFLERWETYDLTTNFWELDPAEDNYWTVNYRDGGLVIPAATFKPRLTLENYSDYCLVSKELSAKDLDGVILAYDIACYNYSGAGGGTREYIETEVWDGTQWQVVETHTNQNGSFDYTRFHIDISDYVKGRDFKIRFNGGGVKGFNINGWYISYVKIYEKAQATVGGTTICGGQPVADATVTWTSQDNDVYRVVSGADGTYRLADVDAGVYTVTATRPDCNPFRTEDILVEKGDKTYDIAMTKPAFSAPAAEAAYEIQAEAQTDGQLTLHNTGNGPARVSIHVDYGTPAAGKTPALKPIKTFRPRDVLQAAICFDGTYFYTAQSDEFGNGIIEKYDRDGNYIESFQPSIHVRRYFGMAFDGADFYTANHDSIIRRMNFETHEILEEIVTPIKNINHIAYDEERDAFYVGALNSIALVGKDGRVIEEETVLPDVLFAGSVYDPYFKEGPTLWIMDQSKTNNTANGYTFAVLRRFDLKTKTVKNDYVFDCTQLEGFVYGGPSVGKVWGESLFGTTRYLDGHFVIMGMILSDPGLAYILDMYETDNWIKPSTYSLNVAAGEAKDIVYTINADNLTDGMVREADLRIVFDPAIPAMSQKVKLQVKGKADLAKPTGLTATVRDDQEAVLTWQAPDAAVAPQSYKIYRNGEAVGTTEAGATTYADNDLTAGLYRYEVTAVYTGGESRKSNEAEIEILIGIPCYVPQNLTARNVRNEEIALTWSTPSAVGDKPATLRWDNGRTDDFCSMTENATFTGAALWTSADLADYRNMTLEAVTFVPMTSGGQYTVKIWEDHTLVREQPVAGGFPAESPYTVKLNEKLTVNDRHSLRVGIEAAGGAALGVDAGPATEGKGNWVYAAAYNRWETLTVMGGSNANFNIALELQPKTQQETNTAKSYNVYRNGAKLNTAPVTETNYTDRPEAGIYTYTVTAVHENCESHASAPAIGRIVDLQEHSAPDDLKARVVMNREVRLQWNHPNTYTSLHTAKSTDGYEPFGYVKDFNLNETGEAAVVTDGEYIYTSFYNRNGVFNKYDLQGRFIESFTIEGAGPMLDLTWDGRYFYGGNNETELYCMDFATHTLIKKIAVTAPVRHCTYIPDLDGGKGGFEIGDWTTSFFVAMNGTYLDKGYANPEGAFGSAYQDGKLYFFQQHKGALCEIIEVDFKTLAATGKRADLNLYGQYAVGTEARAGGLATFTSLNGATMLLANIQNTDKPNKLVWVEATPDNFVSGFNIYRDGDKLNGETPLPGRTYADTLSTPGTYAYTVAAVYIDGVEGDKAAPATITIVEPTHCEAPVNIMAIVQDRDVRLQWTSVIDQSEDQDDMESYAHLTTGKIGDARTIDADGLPTYMPEAWRFSGMGDPASFFVLDQRLLNPAQNDLAFSGNKFLAAFGAAQSELIAVTYSHDWLIMPAAEADGQPQWISFMARGLETGHSESFRVAYSVKGTDTADFIRIAQNPEEVNCLWTRFVFDLPADAKYVAVEYLSGNGKALFIDDITVATGACVFRLDETTYDEKDFVEKVAGYSVYRDGQLLTDKPVRANAYFDGNLPNGTYNYTIKALYNTSCLSEASRPATVSVNYKAPAAAPRNLTGKAQHDTVSLVWHAPAYAEDKMLSYAGSELATALGFSDDAVYYAAQHWEASELLGVFGYRIYAVTALFAEKPSKLDLVIYQDNELVYEQDVTVACKALDVSAFLLDEPFTVDYAKSLTIGFRIKAQAESYTIAVDKGPVAAGKGDRYSDDGLEWVSANQYHNTNGNWFIAALMELPEPAAGSQNGFLGYLIYRNGEPARKELIQNLHYTDCGVTNGIHKYAVAAVYNSGEKMSESISVRVNYTANEDLDDSRLRIFPNPATEQFTVYGPFEYLEIIDLQGKTRLKHEASQGMDVKVPFLPAGIYFVKITSAAGTTVRKLVIRK